MESKGVVFCTIVAVLGIISTATGLAGEFTRVKASEITAKNDHCVYPSSPALALGIISAVVAIITQLYISFAVGGSRCCSKNPNANPTSNSCFGLSRAATVIAVILLFAAAALNNKESGQVDSYGYFTCYVVKPGIFASGAVLALLSAVFGIAAYVTMAPPTTQATTNVAVAYPVGANVDPEKSPVPLYPQQYPPQPYPPRQYA